jgi:hypothetical protein
MAPKQAAREDPQERVLAALRRAQAEGRLAHAYLILGPPGAGKGRLAVRIARQIVCAGDGTAGCTCLGCSLDPEQVRRGRHPDIRLLETPEGKTQLPVEQLREELLQAIQLRSFAGQPQVFVIEEAHRLSPEAQNATLKTLEEPGRNMYILLTSSAAVGVLPTVRSRCHRLYLPPGDRGLGCGGDGDAVAAAREVLGEMLAWLARGGDDVGLMELLAPPGSRTDQGSQEQVMPRLEQLGTLLRDALLLSCGGSVEDLAHPEHAMALRETGTRLGEGRLVRGLQGVIEARWQVRRYVDPSLVALQVAAVLQPAP